MGHQSLVPKPHSKLGLFHLSSYFRIHLIQHTQIPKFKFTFTNLFNFKGSVFWINVADILSTLYLYVSSKHTGVLIE
jgi:hypothetical protein